MALVGLLTCSRFRVRVSDLNMALGGVIDPYACIANV